VEKYGIVGQATGDMHVACYITKATNTIRMFNTYCFSAATVVT
jgi:hypothetical protein